MPYAAESETAMVVGNIYGWKSVWAIQRDTCIHHITSSSSECGNARRTSHCRHNAKTASYKTQRPKCTQHIGAFGLVTAARREHHLISRVLSFCVRGRRRAIFVADCLRRYTIIAMARVGHQARGEKRIYSFSLLHLYTSIYSRICGACNGSLCASELRAGNEGSSQVAPEANSPVCRQSIIINNPISAMQSRGAWYLEGAPASCNRTRCGCNSPFRRREHIQESFRCTAANWVSN